MSLVRCTPAMPQKCPIQPSELPILRAQWRWIIARSLPYDYSGELEWMFCGIEKYEPSRAYNSIAQCVLSETEIVDIPQVFLPLRWMRRGRPSTAGWWRGSFCWGRGRRRLERKRPGVCETPGPSLLSIARKCAHVS